MIDENGFDKDSIDIFDCDTDHSMDSDHVVITADRTCSVRSAKEIWAKLSNLHCYGQCYMAQRAYQRYKTSKAFLTERSDSSLTLWT